MLDIETITDEIIPNEKEQNELKEKIQEMNFKIQSTEFWENNDDDDDEDVKAQE
ncbi:hypothetical protein I4U23_000295 [Adineta vaga]|nr:hypothetical protein I4U23_000295 [Adineta vaga]